MKGNFNTLSYNELLDIHESSLEMISKTGIILEHDKVKDLLLKNGCKEYNGRILIPEELAEESMKGLPTKIKLKGREETIILGDGNTYAHNVGGVPNVYKMTYNLGLKADKELENYEVMQAAYDRIQNLYNLSPQGTRKPAKLIDNIIATRIMDSLENVHTITPFFTPQDIPESKMKAQMFYSTICNTTKPIRGPGIETAEELETILQMRDIIDPKMTFTVDCSPISPLKFSNGIVEATIKGAEKGLILNPLPCPQLGSSCPVTLAGGLTQQNVEIMASVVIARLINPDIPVIYRGRISTINHFTAESVWGNSEVGLVSAATVQLGEFYGLPVNVYGFCTSSHGLDIQSGYERAINAQLPILAGAAEISGVGEQEGGETGGFEQIVIDNEIMSNLLRVRKGIQVNEDMIGTNTVHNVMEGSNFLMEDHTFKHMRDEILNPELSNRNGHDKWQEEGKKTVVHAAKEKIEHIIKNHKVPDLEEKQKEEIEKLILTL